MTSRDKEATSHVAKYFATRLTNLTHKVPRIFGFMAITSVDSHHIDQYKSHPVGTVSSTIPLCYCRKRVVEPGSFFGIEKT